MRVGSALHFLGKGELHESGFDEIPGVLRPAVAADLWDPEEKITRTPRGFRRGECGFRRMSPERFVCVPTAHPAFCLKDFAGVGAPFFHLYVSIGKIITKLNNILPQKKQFCNPLLQNSRETLAATVAKKFLGV